MSVQSRKEMAGSGITAALNKGESRIAARGVRLLSHAEPFDFSLEAGQSCAVMGPDSSGVDELVKLFTGRASHLSGSTFAAPATISGLEGSRRPLTPQSLARSLAGRRSLQPIIEALTACSLWDYRSESISRLPEHIRARCDVLPVLLSDAPLLCMDRALDAFDAWGLSRLWESLAQKLSEGASLLVTTNRPDVARLADKLVVLTMGSCVYEGPPDLLRSAVEPCVIEISTPDSSTARAVVSPFAMKIEEFDGGLRITTDAGQEAAARLLLAGYGSVKSVIVRRPTFDEALLTIVERRVRRRTRKASP